MSLSSLVSTVNGSPVGIRALCVWGLGKGHLGSAPWGLRCPLDPLYLRVPMAALGHSLSEMVPTWKFNTGTSSCLGWGLSKILEFQRDLSAEVDTFPHPTPTLFLLFLDCLASW